MKFYSKIAIGVTVGILALVVISGFIVASSLNKFEYSKQQAQKYINTMSAMIQIQNQHLADKITHIIETVIARESSVKILEENGVIAVGLLKPHASVHELWVSDWVITTVKEIDDALVNKLRVTLSASELGASNIQWMRIKTSDQQVYFMQLFLVKAGLADNQRSTISFAIWPASVFSGVSQIAKSNSGKSFIVDIDGVAYSYPEQQYVGGQINSHPIVASLIKNKKSDEVTSYKDHADQTLIGGYEKISGTNLFSVSYDFFESFVSVIFKYMLRMLIVSIAILGFLLLYIYFLGKKQIFNFRTLEANHKLLQQKLDLALVKKEWPHVPEQESSAHLIDGIVQLFNHPYHIALGTLRMIEHEVGPQFKMKIEKLYLELQNLGSVLDKLNAVSVQKKLKIESVSATKVVNQILAQYKNQILALNVSIEENLSEEVYIRCDYQRLKQIVGHLIVYIFDDFKNTTENRKLVIGVESIESFAKLKFSLVGRTLSEDQKRTIFEPKCRSFLSSAVMGLDLLLARSYATQFLGDLQIESIDGGYELSVQFPSVSLEHVYLDRSLNPTEMGSFV